MSKKKHRSKFKKVILSLLLLIVIVATVLVVVNWELISYTIKNFSSINKGLNYSSEEINAEADKIKEDTAQALSNAGISLTPEQLELLDREDLTEEEKKQILLDVMQGESDKKDDDEPEPDKDNQDILDEPQKDNTVIVDGQQTNKDDIDKDKENVPENDNSLQVELPAVTPTDPEKVIQESDKTEQEEAKDVETSGKLTDEQYNARIAELVAKVYSIKADFMGTLNAFETRIKAEYTALPKEQQTTATKAKIVADNMNYVIGLEAQCDAQVKAVTDSMLEIMIANDKDTSLVEQINSAYESEKELKKAYYISLYK